MARLDNLPVELLEIVFENLDCVDLPIIRTVQKRFRNIIECNKGLKARVDSFRDRDWVGAVEEAASLRVHSYTDNQIASAKRGGWLGAGGGSKTLRLRTGSTIPVSAGRE